MSATAHAPEKTFLLARPRRACSTGSPAACPRASRPTT